MLPSEPRCKLCNAPFHGIGRPVAGFLGRLPSKKNPRFCGYCETIARTYRGGAKVELTLLFADVRGSTTLAEGMTAAEFSRLMNRFYDVATRVLIDSDAWIDKLVGDEVIGLYLPFLENHPARAVHAGQELMRATG
jgi:adenylate cyclase